MDIVSGLALNLVASALSAVLGFLGAKLYSELRKQRPLLHVSKLLGNARRIIVVFPAGATPAPVADGGLTNAIRMSLAEGAAIARIGQLCRDARPGTEMHLVHPRDLVPSKGPFVMIGDPSTSAWAAKWVNTNFPRFVFSPDARRADNDGASWATYVEEGVVKRDFGFVFLGHTETDQPFVLLFGASELGTNIAARAYSDLRPQLSRERYRSVLNRQNFLFVAQGDVVGYGVRTDDVSNVQVVAAYSGIR